MNFLHRHLQHIPKLRGSATQMKMGGGGDGDQAAAKPGFSLYQKPKTQRIWPTIFLKMGGGLSPALSKMGGTRPPSPPVAEPLPKLVVLIVKHAIIIPIQEKYSQTALPRPSGPAGTPLSEPLRAASGLSA